MAREEYSYVAKCIEAIKLVESLAFLPFFLRALLGVAPFYS